MKGLNKLKKDKLKKPEQLEPYEFPWENIKKNLPLSKKFSDTRKFDDSTKDEYCANCWYFEHDRIIGSCCIMHGSSSIHTYSKACSDFQEGFGESMCH